MAKREKLLEKARNNPKGLRFKELEQLVKSYGFYFDHQEGSHRIHKAEGWPKRLTLQPDKNGKAKPYQVKQALTEIDAMLKKQEGE